MFYRSDTSGYKEALKGIRLKTLAYGEKTLLAEFRLLKGSTLPKHSHRYEQIGYLVSGQMLLSVGGETFRASQGDSWCIPSDVEHGAGILADSVAIEVFSPVREDYLPENLGSTSS